MPGKGTSKRYPHGRSIKNPSTYEALRRRYSKSKAAAISNGVLAKGYAKGRHHKHK